MRPPRLLPTRAGNSPDSVCPTDGLGRLRSRILLRLRAHRLLFLARIHMNPGRLDNLS